MFMAALPCCTRWTVVLAWSRRSSLSGGGAAFLIGQDVPGGFVQASDCCSLPDEREHGVNRRRRDAQDPPDLLDHRYQRVDFHRPAALQILHHRGLMRADSTGAVDAPLDIDAEMDTQPFCDRLGLQHDLPRHRPRTGIGCYDVERGEGQGADRIEADIAPEL